MADKAAIITGYGRDRAGRRIFIVSSRSRPGRYHVVTDYGKSLKCDCEAATYHKRCAHVLAVARITGAQSPHVGAISQPRAPDDRVPLWASKGNEPFSMWKK
jgi:hypothetical protein